MKKAIVLTFAVFVLVLSATDIFACSCLQPSSVEETFKTSFAVFSGEVIKVSETDDGIKAKIRVEKTWKGNLPKVITIRSRVMCLFNFIKGKKYLIYAGGKSNKTLAAHLCSRTEIFSKAAEDVAALDKLKRE